MIKQAYINGFMRKCAEHGVDGRRLLRKILVKRAWDDNIGEKTDNALGDIATHKGMHVPVDAHDFVTNLYGRVTGSSPYSYDPAIEGRANMATQFAIDELGDPGAGVRNPTPYELAQLVKNLERLYGDTLNEGQQEADDPGSASSRFYTATRVPGVEPVAYATDPKLQNEWLRRAWNAATNAVPIKYTSPTK